MLYIDEHSGTPLYQQIYEQIKAAIQSGELSTGDKLPATRELAKMLAVGRNTVENSYQQLLVEGYVCSKPGSGYIVTDVADEMFQNPRKTRKNIGRQIDETRAPGHAGGAGCYPPAPGDEGRADGYPPVRYDFHFKNMDSELFPHNLWRKYSVQVLSYYKNNRITSYNDYQGEYGLRQEISKSLYRLRGVECDADQISICCGLQIALEKIYNLLPEEYHHVGMEEPGYDAARLMFEYKNFPITPIPVGLYGDFIKTLRDSPARTLFLTPSHQFPTGLIMPISIRYQVLKWAYDNDGYIIEDDYDSEYRYNTRPIPALQSIDTDERVIYIGTFSKVLSPSLRISYMVMPKHMAPIYRYVYRGLHPTTPWMQQEILALFMKDGQLEKHMRKCFHQYKERHNCVIQEINRNFGDRVKIIGHNSGLHILLMVKGAASQEELIHKARKHGVKVYPTTPYWMVPENCPKDLVMVGYAQLGVEEIKAGIRLLKDAWLA